MVKPLKFCGKGTMEIVKDVTKHWAIGTVGDAGTTMLTTYVSDRFDGKSPQEAFQNVMSSADDILVDSMWTSAAGTLVDSVTAPKCFVAGTMITTISGLKAIEQIQAGDLVLAANEETGEVAYKEVVRTFVNTTDEITHVTIENAEGEQETIDSTPEHPFYVEGLGWVEASSLHAGMTIWFANGTKGTVEDISNEGLEEPVTVYNFEVKDFHTYYVGESGVLVHNTCPNKATSNQTQNETDANENNAQKRPSWRQSELDAAKEYQGYEQQKSFIGGEDANYGDKGSVRPDFYKNGTSVDVKNYNVTTSSGRNKLARNVEKQYYQRKTNLPEGTKQVVLIDVRGQKVSNDTLQSLKNNILSRTENSVTVRFKTK